jgi:hypothetical protein
MEECAAGTVVVAIDVHVPALVTSGLPLIQIEALLSTFQVSGALFSNSRPVIQISLVRWRPAVEDVGWGPRRSSRPDFCQ